MSNFRTMLAGVIEELWLDLGDGVWMLLQTFGLGPLLTRLREEAAFSNGRKRRSLVRILGSALPLKPIERPYLRYVALRSLSNSCDSLYSSQAQCRIDPKWLADTEKSSRGFRPIISRCETAPELIPLSMGFDDDYDDSPRSSTPFSVTSDLGHYRHPQHYQSSIALNSLHHQSTMQHSALQHSTVHASSPFTDPMALAKISAMEDELTQLRLQISTLIKQTQCIKTPPPTPVSSVPPPPPPPPPPLNAAPPPPPLPSLPNMNNMSSSTPVSRKTSFAELIAQNKDNINKHSEPLDIKTSTPVSTGVSMTDVLKGLNKVKLKKVARSPGGTPVRERPSSPIAGDPAAIIAAALKKRFARINVDSPDKDAEESNDFNSSPESTPQNKRRSHLEILPKRKIEQEESPVVLNLTPLLRKPSLRSVKTKPKEEEKPALPL
ncbi:Mitochondrial fission regulator 2, partial [Halocaridina rubra]